MSSLGGQEPSYWTNGRDVSKIVAFMVIGAILGALVGYAVYFT